MPKPVGEQLRELCSPEPVHGVGERFTETERQEVISLLGIAYLSLDDPILDKIYGETIINIQEYLALPAGATEEKMKLRNQILDEFDEARTRYGEDSDIKLAA